jgi:hypothetical protein
MKESQTAPPVSDEILQKHLEGVTTNSEQSFKHVMQGVQTRIEAVTSDSRLGRIFNHSPDDTDDVFNFSKLLNEDVLVIFNSGSLQPDPQRALTLVILSKLWGALKRRKRQSHIDADNPLVNVYLEEAATIATSDMLGNLLAEAREFDTSITLSAQFPKQFRKEGATDDDGRDAQSEVLNNIGSLILGKISKDQELAESLATRKMDSQEVADRLRALKGGRWMLDLDAPHGQSEPRPFFSRSLPLPPGHPDGDRPVTDDEQRAIEAIMDEMFDYMLGPIGMKLHDPNSAERSIQDGKGLQRVDSALGLTQRLPDCVEYDKYRHAIKCESCQSHHDPNIDGMRRAINCCHDLDAVDRDDVPVCEINLKLTAEERAAAALTDRQLCFLQVVHDAQQGHHDPLEFDLIRDSMTLLKEYLDIDNEAVKELTNSDLLNRDIQPHLLYSVPADGRNVINETHRAGLDHGDGVGDLTESSQHILAVEVARRYLEAEYVNNDDESVVETRPYYGTGDGHRLDLVGLDADGEIAVAVEVERSNQDRKTAAPADFDKIATTGCEDAIWVVMSRSKGHEILTALNDPDDGDQRVGKTYSSGTPIKEVTIDTAGLTEIYTIGYIRDELGLKE